MREVSDALGDDTFVGKGTTRAEGEEEHAYPPRRISVSKNSGAGVTSGGSGGAGKSLYDQYLSGEYFYPQRLLLTACLR